LLEKYKDNDFIYHIAGYNPLGNRKSPYSYYFARIQHCWGWATWRRAWCQFRYDINGLDDFIGKKKINQIFRRKCDREYWLRIFKKMENYKNNDIWDYQWTYAIFKSKGLCVNPSKNLISNIGFGNDATHTTGTNNNQMRYDMLTIKHPKNIRIDNFTINRINKIGFGIENWFTKKHKRNKQRFIKFLKLYKQFLLREGKLDD
jgi:hypothetical protein